MISICIPSLRTSDNARALKVCMACIADNTQSDYELLIDVHGADYDLYESFNRLAEQARGDYLVWLCDDNFVAPAWDQALLAAAAPDTLVIGAMVESGIIPVAEQCVNRFFGDTPETFDRQAFEQYVQNASYPDVQSWSCPWLLPKRRFLEMGGFDTAIRGIWRAQLELVFLREWPWQTKRAPAWCYHLMRWTSRNGGPLNGVSSEL